MPAYRVDACRLCRGKLSGFLLDLGNQPLANGLCASKEEALWAPTYPLRLVRCLVCGSVQLTHDVTADELFGDYPYRSSTSKAFRAHFSGLADRIAALLPDGPGFAVDVGANDGILLEPLQDLGWNVLGVEPCRALAEEANKRGLATFHDYFTEDTARMIRSLHGHADVVTACNVFAHVSDLGGVLRAVRGLLKPDGWFIFEVYYLPNLLTDPMGWTALYHEHCFTHHVAPLRSLLSAHGFTLVEVEDISTHGGSIRGFARRSDSGAVPERGVATHRHREEREGVGSIAPFERMAANIEQMRTGLPAFLRAFPGKVVGYTAPAKATVLLNALGIGPEILPYVVEDAPSKQGKFIPGVGIPIVSPESLRRETQPLAVLLLAWNIPVGDVVTRLPGGTKVVIPGPEPKIVDPWV